MFIFGSRFAPEPIKEKIDFEPKKVEETSFISVALSVIRAFFGTESAPIPAPQAIEEKISLRKDVEKSSKTLRREDGVYNLFATAVKNPALDYSVIDLVEQGNLRQLVECLKRTPKTDELGFGFRLAAKKGSIAIIDFLIRQGDIDPKHIIESLAIAAKFGKLDVVERLTSLFPFNSYAIGKALREATKSHQKECIDFLSKIYTSFDEDYFEKKRMAP